MNPIPSNIYQRIQEWIEAQRTGKVILNINEGRVETAEFSDKVKAKKPEFWPHEQANREG